MQKLASWLLVLMLICCVAVVLIAGATLPMMPW